LGWGRISVSHSGPRLGAALLTVLESVERGADTPDAAATAAEIDPHEAAVALGRLELLGYVAVDGSGAYSRTSLSPPGV
jgi:hypothetical protein